MTRHQPPRIGLWLLTRLVRDSEPIAGDLVEQFGVHPSRAWFWWQVLAAIAFGFGRRSDEIRPLRLVEAQPAEAAQRAREFGLRFKPINIGASPLAGISGFGIVVLLLFTASVAPAVWWPVLASIAAGVLLGVARIALKSRHRHA